MGDIFDSYMRGYSYGDAQSQQRRRRNALSGYQNDPEGAQNALVSIGELDDANMLNAFNQQRQQDDNSMRMAKDMRAARQNALALPNAVPPQVAATMPPNALAPPQPAVPATTPTPQPVQPSPPASPALAGGPQAPAVPAVAGAAPQAAAPVAADPQAAADPTADPNAHVDAKPGQMLAAAEAQDPEIAQLQAGMDAALQGPHPDINTWNNMRAALQQRQTQAVANFNGQLQFLAAGAAQLMHVPPEQRLAAAQQYLQNSPYANQPNFQNMMQQLQGRLDPNRDGTISDDELQAFQRSTMTYAEQLAEDHATETQRIQRIAAQSLADYRGSMTGGGAGYTGGAVGTWSEQAIRNAAARVVNGDPNVLQNMRDQRVRGAIESLVADSFEQSGDDVRALTYRRAAQASNSHALQQLETTRTMVQSAEHSVEGLFPRIRELSRRVNLTNSPMLNRAILAFRQNVGMTGGPRQGMFDRSGWQGARTAAGQGLQGDTQEYYNLITEAMMEYGKVISGSYGAGGSSDASMEHAMAMMNAAQSPEQLEAAISAAIQAMQARVSGYSEEHDRLQGSMSNIAADGGNGGAGGGAPASGDVPGVIHGLTSVDRGLITPQQFQLAHGMSVDEARQLRSQLSPADLAAASQTPGSMQIDGRTIAPMQMGTGAQSGRQLIPLGNGRSFVATEQNVTALARHLQAYDADHNDAHARSEWTKHHAGVDVGNAREIVRTWQAQGPTPQASATPPTPENMQDLYAHRNDAAALNSFANHFGRRAVEEVIRQIENRLGVPTRERWHDPRTAEQQAPPSHGRTGILG